MPYFRPLLTVIVLITALLPLAVACDGTAEASSSSPGEAAVADLAVPTAIVSGVAELPEGEAAPPGAVALVEIRDVSFADGPSRLIAATEFDASDASEIPFRIAYVDARIDPERRDYAVSVSINQWVPDLDVPFSGRDELIYTTDRRTEVISRGNPNSGITVPLKAVVPYDGPVIDGP